MEHSQARTIRRGTGSEPRLRVSGKDFTNMMNDRKRRMISTIIVVILAISMILGLAAAGISAIV